MNAASLLGIREKAWQHTNQLRQGTGSFGGPEILREPVHGVGHLGHQVQPAPCRFCSMLHLQATHETAIVGTVPIWCLWLHGRNVATLQ